MLLFRLGNGLLHGFQCGVENKDKAILTKEVIYGEGSVSAKKLT